MLSLDMFEALGYLVTQGVPHRDVKTSNVLLSCACEGLPGTDNSCIKSPGCRVTAKLCDFGLAKVEIFAEASSGNLAGTMAYMAPERIQRHLSHTGPSGDGRRHIVEADEFDELEGDNDSLIDYFASDVYSASLVALEMYVYAQTGTYTKVRLQHNTNNIFSREGRGGMVDDPS